MSPFHYTESLSQMAQHREFILTPMSTLMEEAKAALINIDVGICTFPISEYFFKSLFLKMTGFQEQKLKCICWDMATHDYEYRYERYSHGFKPGECSEYKDKCLVLADIIGLIKKSDVAFDTKTYIDLPRLIQTISNEIELFYKEARVNGWLEHEYKEYKNFFHISPICFDFTDKGHIFKKIDNCPKQNCCASQACAAALMSMEDIYTLAVYRFRNQCAHNTTSYQKDIVSFDQMHDVGYIYRNYFVRFFMLLLMDSVFVEFYEKYLSYQYL